MTCAACKGSGPEPVGRYAFSVFPISGAGDHEFDLTYTINRLAEIGTVRTVGTGL
jgi:hypothetical protein